MYIIVEQKKIKLYKCDRFYTRFKGLMFKKSFNYALLFSKCNSIHTCFMRTNIDVIMTDINNNILYVFSNLKPWKIILPKKNVYNTYELPSGTVTKDLKKIVIERE